MVCARCRGACQSGRPTRCIGEHERGRRRGIREGGGAGKICERHEGDETPGGTRGNKSAATPVTSRPAVPVWLSVAPPGRSYISPAVSIPASSQLLHHYPPSLHHPRGHSLACPANDTAAAALGGNAWWVWWRRGEAVMGRSGLVMTCSGAVIVGLATRGPGRLALNHDLSATR